MPKSAILIPPSAVTIRFSGLRSRWTIPRSCACASPASRPSSTPPIWAERELADERPQRALLHVLHRDVRDALVLEVVVHGDDVRVAHRAGDPRLGDEAAGPGRVARHGTPRAPSARRGARGRAARPGRPRPSHRARGRRESRSARPSVHRLPREPQFACRAGPRQVVKSVSSAGRLRPRPRSASGRGGRRPAPAAA